MIEVKVSDPLANFDEAAAMLQANWLESNSPVEFVAEDTRKFYEYLATMGALFAVGARIDDKLIGYCIVTVVPHPLNHSVKVCNAEGTYVLPEHRGGTVFGRLRDAVKLIARSEQANYIQWHAPAGTEFSDMLANRMTPTSNYFREDLLHE